MRARLSVGLVLSLFVYAACGGRLIENGNEGGSDTGAGPATGGSSSQGATSQTGATTSRGGRKGTAGAAAIGGVSAGGRLGTGGVPSMGAAPSAGTLSIGGGCACSPIACASGYVIVPNANGCCSHCESVCSNVICPGVACGSGSHLEVLPGQCCPTCIQDSCQDQLQRYQDVRKQFIEKYTSVQCAANVDCTIYYEKTQCAVGCGVAVPHSVLNDLESNLQSFAQNNCSPDCTLPTPPCDPRPAPVCLQGRCQ
jgi:hypothetical protein